MKICRNPFFYLIYHKQFFLCTYKNRPKKIAKIINEAYTKFTKLVVIAPPQVLGELRKKLNEHVLPKITLEIPKDLTKHPIEEIKGYI